MTTTSDTAKQATKKRRFKFSNLYLIAIIVFIVYMFGYILYNPISAIIENAQYPEETVGIVSGIHYGGRMDTYSVTYKVDGKTYTSTTLVDVGDIGDRTTVHYDKSDPGRASVATTGQAYGTLDTIGIAFGAIAAYLFVFMPLYSKYTGRKNPDGTLKRPSAGNMYARAGLDQYNFEASRDRSNARRDMLKKMDPIQPGDVWFCDAAFADEYPVLVTDIQYTRLYKVGDKHDDGKYSKGYRVECIALVPCKNAGRLQTVITAQSPEPRKWMLPPGSMMIVNVDDLSRVVARSVVTREQAFSLADWQRSGDPNPLPGAPVGVSSKDVYAPKYMVAAVKAVHKSVEYGGDLSAGLGDPRNIVCDDGHDVITARVLISSGKTAELYTGKQVGCSPRQRG